MKNNDSKRKHKDAKGIIKRRRTTFGRAHSCRDNRSEKPRAIPKSEQVLLQKSGLAPFVLEYAPEIRVVTLANLPLSPLPGLPTGYFFKGGAGREWARRCIHSDEEPFYVRDYDVVRFMHTSDEHDHVISEKFMGDDYEFGRGVEVVENRALYFQTRDLSVNEVLAGSGELALSMQAIADLLSHTLRPTPFVTNRSGEVLSATIAKMYRFAAEAQVKGNAYQFADMPSSIYSSDFYLALNLERSFASNEAVAGEYVQLIWEAKLCFLEWEVPPPLEDALKYFAERIVQGYSLFKSVSPEVLRRLSRLG